MITDSCTYQIDKEDVVVSELFALFNNVKDEIGIVDWGIKMTTLEDGKLITLSPLSPPSLTLSPPLSHSLSLIYLHIFSLCFSSLSHAVFLNIVKSHTDTRNESSYSTCPAWFPCQCCYKSRTGVQ